MTDSWEEDVATYRLYLEARSQRNAFFDKLTILNGSTVALVLTAVIGPLRGVVKHKYVLALGLTFLVAGMLALLVRNFQGVKLEFHAAASTARHPQYLGNPSIGHEADRLNEVIYVIESVGMLLSAMGIVLLLIEVWLILV